MKAGKLAVQLKNVTVKARIFTVRAEKLVVQLWIVKCSSLYFWATETFFLCFFLLFNFELFLTSIRHPVYKVIMFVPSLCH